VLAVFLLLGVSGLGIFGTLALSYMKGSEKFVSKVLQIFKMFGIGIIIATAWIHLLPEAFASFSSECLTGYWTRFGVGYVGLFALIATFFIQMIENKTMGYGNHLHGHAAHAHGPVHSPAQIEMLQPNTDPRTESDSNNESEAKLVENNKEKFFTIELVEMGVLVHSLVIGLTLGVERGDAFTALLIAIAFHQFFEGMSLGVMVGMLPLLESKKKIVMCLLYPLTTPLGIAIGICVHQVFSSNSQGFLVTQGILESLSSGVLMYNAYCGLLAVEINKNPSFGQYAKSFRTACYLAMYAGAGVMAIIGLWA
jgi:zinc transporter 1/2/3